MAISTILFASVQTALPSDSHAGWIAYLYKNASCLSRKLNMSSLHYHPFSLDMFLGPLELLGHQVAHGSIIASHLALEGFALSS